MSNDAWYLYHVPRFLAGMSPERIAVDRDSAEIEIKLLARRLRLTPQCRILEIGCGWGRHSMALAQQGFVNVLSIDISPDALKMARQLSSEMELRCNFHLQSFCDVEERGLDAILSLYDRSCCGFPTEEEDLGSLRHLAMLLKPGGHLIFGINDWPFHLPRPSQIWRSVSDGSEVEDVIVDRLEMTCTHRMRRFAADGTSAEYSLTRRHYYLPELRKLLFDAGFELVHAQHKLLDDRPYGDGGDGLFIYARRM